jgi:CheY-like chemotaxis protein
MGQYPYILVIDNATEITELISEVLTDEGYIVLSDSTRASALPTSAGHFPALCLVDLRTPGVNGLEVIEALRTRQVVQVPIVAMTTSPQTAERVRAAGFDCLDKPFHIDELLACVAHYITPQQVPYAQTA